MDQQTNEQEPSSTKGGQVKVGDKVYMLCEVVNRSENSVWVEVGSRFGRVCVDASDCRPVEPVIEDSLTTEPNCPGIPDSSSESIQVGDTVRFVWPGHKWHGTEGAIISTVGDPSIFVDIKEYPYRFKSGCGAFERWCSADQLERIDKADPINPSHYKHLPAEAIDIIMAAIARAPSNGSAFLQGQVIKYLLRCWSKKGIEDLRKAKWYLDRLVGGFDDLLAEASGANDEVGE